VVSINLKSRRTSNTPARMAAVGYLRRSTRKQEKSLDDQRREVTRYAEQHGYHVIRWYQDEISGDETERRTDFLRMIHDAENKGDFAAVLCWDQDRFGRFDSLDAGKWVYPLRRAGVRLVTVTEGPVAWDDFTGRMMYSIKQEGKHQFLVDLSRNTARGQVTAVSDGWLTGRAACYGMDRMIVDEAGNHRQRVHNGEQFAKPRSWHVTLVPSDDPEKVKVAHWLFETYANQDVGLRYMVNELNRRGVPGPRGGPWHVGTVREILCNECYCGDFYWPKRRMGKYHCIRAAGAEIRSRNGDAGTVTENDPSEQIRHQGIFPALVDRKTWERVQQKLRERRERRTPFKAKNMDRYLLSGMVFCAECGAKMHGQQTTRRKGGRTYHYAKYICSSYHTKGKHVCGSGSIDQADLLAVLLGKLREAVLAGGCRDELRNRIIARLRAKAAGPSDAEALRKRLDSLDQEIQTGARRLLKSPDDLADILGAELSTLRRERDRVADELEAVPEPIDVEATADEAIDRLWSLADELQKARPERLRELLRRMVARIDLHFDRVQRGKRLECPFSNGTIHLRPDPAMCRVVSRGDWI
jgi:site-specific DNA recombinase